MCGVLLSRTQSARGSASERGPAQVPVPERALEPERVREQAPERVREQAPGRERALARASEWGQERAPARGRAPLSAPPSLQQAAARSIAGRT